MVETSDKPNATGAYMKPWMTASPSSILFPLQSIKELEKSYLVILRCSGVERPAQEQLSDDTTQGPHVNGLTERQTQDDLWSSADTEIKEELQK